MANPWINPAEFKWVWWRKLSRREWIVLAGLALLLTAIFWRNWIWRPSVILQTEHFVIYSTATREQTQQVAQAAEEIYRNYLGLFPDLNLSAQEVHYCKMKLYGSRDEFKKCHPLMGWAEAFYRWPYAYAYYSAEETAPYQWMVHELVHQLNREVAGFKLAQWLDEGLAEYFSTSLLAGGKLRLGQVDANTYPVWWFEQMATEGNLDRDLQNGSIISLKTILSGQGGPAMSRHFNLYYLHWWTLVHFLFEYENGQYRHKALQLIRKGGSLDQFVILIGPLNQIESAWYRHVLQLKKQFG